jgi:stearoyl-CoA desaturase (delta-9 desaturase)
VVSFIVPALIGYYYALYSGNMLPSVGALGGFLIPGVARVVMVQHATFCINSLCHMIGKQPYSTEHSARDSWIAAIFTMGEGYHNYHHEFAWDYRNGVKPWQLDPSKWIIWTLSKIGMTSDLKRVANERILLAETKEVSRIVEKKISAFQSAQSKSTEIIDQAVANLEKAGERLSEIHKELQTAIRDKIDISKSKMNELRLEVRSMVQEIESFGKLSVA